SELRRLECEHESLTHWARVQQVREAVRTCVPLGATVIITAPPGDPLLHLDGREVWGFPNDWGAATGGVGRELSLVEELRQLQRHGAAWIVLTAAGRSLMSQMPALGYSLAGWHVVWSDEACEICSGVLSGQPGAQRPEINLNCRVAGGIAAPGCSAI